MDASLLAREAYGAGASQPLRDPRALEYSVIARITNSLRAVQESSAEFHDNLVSAVHENRQLWTFIAASVADDANKLPTELRASLFHLSECVEHTSGQILRNRSGLDLLIEINGCVLQGLGRTGGPE